MPLINPDEEIRAGYSHLAASANRRPTNPEPPAPPLFPRTIRDRPRNAYAYGEFALGSSVEIPENLPPPKSPPSLPPPSPVVVSTPKDDEKAEDQDELYAVGILDLPSPPTFSPVEEDDIDAEEEMINKLLKESEASMPEDSHVVPSDRSQEKRVVWRQRKAFSTSLVHSQHHRQATSLMDHGELSKYLRYVATKPRQDEEIEAILRKYDNSDIPEEQRTPAVVREEAVLVMGMTVEGAENSGVIIVEEDQFEWVDDTENGKSFKVSKNLTVDTKVQGRFFTKIVWIKAIQLVWISLWLFIVGRFESVRSAVVKSHDWAFFVALGMFIALFIVTRLMGRKKSSWHCCSITLLLILITSIMAYPLASVQYTYEVQIVSVSVWILLGSCLLMGIVPFLCECVATPPNWSHTGIVVTLLSGVTVLLISMFARRSMDIRYFTLYIWFPSLFVAEVVLWVMVWELRCIVQGYAFKVSEARWYFASLWV